jgi:flagellar protein FliJ
MKPFTLENVLAYRKRQEDIAQHRLAEAKKVFRQVEQKLIEEKEILSQLSRCSERMQSEGVLITELIRYEERILQVKANTKAIAKTLDEKKEIVLLERQNLINKAKERQILDRLKERQNKAWAAFLEKKETTMLDEIAILRHEAEKN